MPIILKDFTWKQLKEKITIQVPLHGVPLNRVDIFISPQYIKATFESYFFEVILLNAVDIAQSICTKTPQFIVFELKKLTDEFWDSLEDGNLTKVEKNTLKKKLLEEEHERIKKQFEDKIIKKAELKRVAINEQIQLDTKTRSQIENVKKFEEKKAIGDINKWNNTIESRRKSETSKIIKISNNNKKIVAKPKPKHEIPKPRSTKALQILFTPREFPTPSRESKLEEENVYLARQAAARRSAGFVSEDLRPEEKNPQYLLAKGREFLKNKNYLGAISAFSFGIKLSPEFVDLYIVRSEAHLAIGNFSRVTDDCSEALKLLRPALPVNLQERALCIGRRGIGLFNLGFFKQGIDELEASVKLCRSDEFESALSEYKLKFEEIKLKKAEEKKDCCKDTNELT
ncbi:unnamed protein product [Ceutorhynchus assimilis]|uniref:CS domain-containing protein n=1 Tax=Ceutorhynchus assimilis TaxID=467358 RepID=A0A9N9QPG1_9CUCU|nr:unnamed protein product [Ceutorhynchus assimilis]